MPYCLPSTIGRDLGNLLGEQPEGHPYYPQPTIYSSNGPAVCGKRIANPPPLSIWSAPGRPPNLPPKRGLLTNSSTTSSSSPRPAELKPSLAGNNRRGHKYLVFCLSRVGGCFFPLATSTLRRSPIYKVTHSAPVTTRTPAIMAPWRDGNAEWFLFIIVPTC